MALIFDIGKWRSNAGSPEWRNWLFKSGVGALSVRCLSVLLTLLVTALLARLLGAEGYGIYSYVLALVTIVSIPAQFGLPSLVVRETAKAEVGQDWAGMKGVWRWANAVALLLSLLSATIAFIVAQTMSEQIPPEKLSTFGFGILLVPLAALVNLRGAALNGLRKVVLGALPDQVIRPVVMLLAIGLILLIFPLHKLNSTEAMALMALAALVALSASAWFLARVKPKQIAHPGLVTSYQHMVWAKASMVLGFVAAMQIINTKVDLIILGWFVSASEIGIYSVVVQTALVVAFGLKTANMVVAPYFARLYAQGDIIALQSLVTLSARVILVITIPVVLIIAFAGELILGLAFGSDYKAGATSLAILAVGQLVNAMMGSVGFLLNMTGHERDLAIGVGIAALCNIVLNLMLVPNFGLEGAASATACSMILWNFWLWRTVQRKLGIKSTAFGI